MAQKTVTLMIIALRRDGRLQAVVEREADWGEPSAVKIDCNCKELPENPNIKPRTHYY
jgi:hypothetical protein